MMGFYVIDGLDGSGKDTQAYMLMEYLSRNGHEAILRIHPASDSIFGRASKRALMGRGPIWRTAATVFYGLDVFRSLLLYYRDGRDVIFVRYTMACAYLPRPLVKPTYSLVSLILPRSPNMFFLDVEPGEALRRIHLRGNGREMFESLEHLRKNRERALLITDGWKVVDGNGTPGQVFEQIIGFLSNVK